MEIEKINVFRVSSSIIEISNLSKALEQYLL